VERGKIDNKHIYDCLLYDLSTGTWLTCVEVKLVW
jgi:hypothetical protein